MTPESTPKIEAPAPNTEIAPTTYEECMALLESTKSETEPANLRAALNKLGGFFKTRVGKRKTETDRDGGAAVKTALAATRTFKAFTPKSLTP
jgi:hypothetical protein